MRQSLVTTARSTRHGLLAALVTVAALAAAARADGIRLFGDSPSAGAWDASWGYATSPSFVVLAGGSHFPVDTTRAFIGSNALRLTWLSSAGGDWMLCAATANWTPVSLATVDTLLFEVWSPLPIAAADLPDLLLEDSGNVRTPRHPMGAYVAGVPAGVWTRVAVPLADIRSNPGAANLASVNKLFFAQAAGNTPGTAHGFDVDEIRFVPAGGSGPSAPAVSARPFELHAELRWEPASMPGVETVRIERLAAGQWTRVADLRPDDGAWVDWRGTMGDTQTWRVTALDWHFLSATSAPVSATTAAMTDAQWLDMTEEAAVRFFWYHAHPVSGLARERYGSGDQCATGGTGMGLMATIAGADRGWIPRAAAAARVLEVLEFYATHPTRYHGAFAHWLDGSSGATLPADRPDDPAGDIVETSYLMQGALAARRYFDGADATETQLRAVATQLFEGVDWNAYRPASPGDAVDWLWSPLTGFASSFPVSGWNECLIVYLLATASPTHPVPASCYTTGWSRYGAMVNGNTYYGHPLYVGSPYGGPMFFAHYSFLGFDPRGRRDAYANYFLQNRSHALIQAAYGAANPYGFAGYGRDVWGWTASDDPAGYAVHAPYSGDDGTLAPTAALADMPYVPDASLAAMKAMYRGFGAGLWGPFGFRDAFNPGQSWVAQDYIAIDEGPIAVMIENARSGLLWDRFMANPEIAPALAALGFVPDAGTAGAAGGPAAPGALALAPPRPNPTAGPTVVGYALPAAARVRLSVLDVQGREVAVLADGLQPAGAHAATWGARGDDGSQAAPGVYLVRLRVAGAELARKVCVLR